MPFRGKWFFLALLWMGAGCFSPLEQPNWTGFDGGMSRYATTAWFTPGAGSPHGEGDKGKVLGAADGDMLSLGKRGLVTLSFSDTPIYDLNGMDFTIHGRWDGGEEAAILGSSDGARFVHIATLTGQGSVDLSVAGLRVITHLQIADSGKGNGIDLDAVEILSLR